MIKNDFETSRRFIVNRPLTTVLLCLAVVAVVTSGMARLAQTTDYRIYFGEDNPQLQAFEEFEAQFEQKELLVVGVEAEGGDIFTPDSLSAVRELTRRGWELPYALRSTSLSNFQNSYADGDDIIVEALVPDEGPISPEKAAEIKRFALASDEIVGNTAAADGSAAAIYITTPLPRENLEAEVPEVANAIRALTTEIGEKYPGHKFHISGVIMLNDAMAQTTQYDLETLFPAAYLLILFGLIAYFRRLIPALATWTVVILSTLAAYGSAGWMGVTLNAASMSSGMIVMTLAVADCVHILVTYYYGIEKQKTKLEAMLESLRLNLQPVFLTSITTAIGFLSLNFSDSPPFRDLGNIVAVGVMFAFLLSAFFMPAMMMWLPAKGKKHVQRRWTDYLADIVIDHQKPLLLGVGALILLLSAGIPMNRFGDNYAEYFSEDIPFRGATDYLNETVVGMQQMQYTLTSDEPGGVNDPEFLREMEELESWFLQQPNVRKVISIVDINKRLNKTMHGDDEEWYRLPDNQELAAQYLFFYELSLPQGLSLNTIIDPDKQLTRFVVLMDNVDATTLVELSKDAQAWMLENMPSSMVGSAEPVGIGLMFAQIAKRNFYSMIGGMLVALIMISALMMWMMRSLRVGLISIVPNVVPALMGFGLWGFLVGQIGISLAIVGSMTLGIVVDDTVHFLSKYLRARREGNLPPEEAVRYAFHNVGSALTLTTMILAGGFLIISMSSYLLTAHMGQLTAMTIMLALICDFLFLPPLLMLLDRDKTNNTPKELV
ncbi:MAG: MMPL family transporter [Gammaproteobacteria bacterium]|nr:MMPL family transporter [Gammaproteobacteria bacterium]